MAKQKQAQETIEVQALSTESLCLWLVGTTPLLMNSMSEKTLRILTGIGEQRRKNAAARAASLKHDFFAEFRGAAYVIADEQSPTYLGFPATAIKSALCDAALAIPGAKKAEIGRLTYVRGNLLPVYGIPQMHIGVARCADPQRTPDLRTRVILERWCIQATVSYITPLLKAPAIANLLAAAGMTIGVGDYRQGKGKGSYGMFRVCDHSDPEVQELLLCGREAQIAAMERAEPYDEETKQLLEWWLDAARRRGFSPAVASEEERANA